MTDTQPTGQGRLSVAATTTDGIHVLTVAGELDHHTGEAVRRALDLPEVPRARVVIDMRRVTFIDSSGINLFIAAQRGLTEAGGWLRLAAPTATVLRTLQIVGIDAFIDCRETLGEALAH